MAPEVARPRGDGRSALIAVGLMLVATALFSMVDAISKHLTLTYPVILVVWVRYAAQLVLMTLVLGPRFGLRLVRTHRPGMQMIRAFFHVAAMTVIVTSFRFMPLTDAIAIGFATPLLVTAFAVPLLGERVDALRWAAVAFGFLGTLIIIRPGSAVFTWPALLPLVFAVFYAIYQLQTRVLAATEHPVSMLYYSGLVGTVVLAPVLPFAWATPPPAALLMMTAMGALGGVGHYLLILAYGRGEASLVAPFTYAHLVWVAVLSYLVFNDVPDAFTLLGSAVVVASGIVVSLGHARAR